MPSKKLTNETSFFGLNDLKNMGFATDLENRMFLKGVSK